MEMSKLVPELIRRFDFTLSYPNRKLTTENVWFVKQMNLEIMFIFGLLVLLNDGSASLRSI